MKTRASYALLLVLLFAACTKDQISPLQKPSFHPQMAANANAAVTLSESFESGTKSAYAAAAVTLSSGQWYLDDALIGNLTSDAKNGARSVRIRNTGSLAMNFDASGGATTITVSHAVFGSDGSSDWQLWISTNGGSSYSQAGGTITSTSTSLQTVTFNVSISGSFRLSIRKVSGGAVADVAYPANYLMIKSYYALSYHRDRGTPNWVSWHLGSADLGSTTRQNDFRADNTLPTGWYQVQSNSYSGSGFDRGHNCPSADRTTTVDANSATFLMTNMIPQAPNNNQQTWNNLESYSRSLVSAGNEVYIIMGCYGIGGTGSNGTANTINNGHVTVPSRIWKVLVVIPDGSNDLSRITASTRVIAVNTPNINSISSDWKQYRTSVDAIESATGYDLLSNVPVAVQQVIEGAVDNQ